MTYLIDTHVLLWIVGFEEKLSKKVTDLYLDENNEILISMASVWEIAIKSSLNKLDIGLPLSKFVEEHILANNIQILNFSLPQIYRIETLPYHHRDPFDRAIIAQAINENIPVITRDKHFPIYDINCVW